MAKILKVPNFYTGQTEKSSMSYAVQHGNGWDNNKSKRRTKEWIIKVVVYAENIVIWELNESTLEIPKSVFTVCKDFGLMSI
jgi:hypothetical protein